MISTILVIGIPTLLLIGGTLCFFAALSEKRKHAKKIKNDELSRMDNIV